MNHYEKRGREKKLNIERSETKWNNQKPTLVFRFLWWDEDDSTILVTK